MTEIKSNADIAPCLSVVMPVFNEAATVADVIKDRAGAAAGAAVRHRGRRLEDGTWDKLQPLAQNDPRIKLVRHEVNQGKGAALRTGIAHATSPIVIIQDADLEYDPAEYHRLLAPILSGKADVVFGSRFIGVRRAPRVVLLALGREQNAHDPFQHGDRT